MSAVYAVASGKGGVGKSSIAANLAAALAQEGSRVIIVDADIGLRSQDALLSLQDRVVFDLIDLAEGECLLSQAILASMEYPSLFLLPAAQFARVKELDPKKLRKIIRSLRCSYDFVLIDCPAGIERGLRNVLNAGVDDVLLIATPDDICLRSAERVVQVMEAKNMPRPRIIVNRLDENLIRSGEMISARTASEVLDLQLLGEIPDDAPVYRSVLNHSLFLKYDCEARRAILRIAARIKGQPIPFPCYGNKRPSIWARLFPKTLKEVTPIDDH